MQYMSWCVNLNKEIINKNSTSKTVECIFQVKGNWENMSLKTLKFYTYKLQGIQ